MMKRLLLPVVVCLLVGCSSLLQAQAAGASSVQPIGPSALPMPPQAAAPDAKPLRTVKPSPFNNRVHAAWNDDCRARVAAAQGHPVDILFVGDSITANWISPPWGGQPRGLAVWDRYYAGRNALNFGVGGDQTENVMWRLENMDVASFRPKVVVLMIGTNNTKDPAPDIAAGVRAILDKLAEMYPGEKTILVSILPNSRVPQLAEDTNALTRQFADNRKVFYLDLAAQMPPVGDNWLGIGNDHLHPVEAGYEIWAKAMEPLLEKLGIPKLPPTRETSGR